MEYFKDLFSSYIGYEQNKKEENSYIFDIKSEEEIKLNQRKVMFRSYEDKIICDEDENLFNYKHILITFLSILLLTIKIIYKKLLYK